MMELLALLLWSLCPRSPPAPKYQSGFIGYKQQGLALPGLV